MKMTHVTLSVLKFQVTIHVFLHTCQDKWNRQRQNGITTTSVSHVTPNLSAHNSNLATWNLLSISNGPTNVDISPSQHPPTTHPHQTPATRHKKRTEEGSVSEIMRPRVPRLLRAPSADFIVCPLSARHTIVTHKYDCISRLILFIYI